MKNLHEVFKKILLELALNYKQQAVSTESIDTEYKQLFMSLTKLTQNDIDNAEDR